MGLGQKKSGASRVYRDGRIVLSRYHWDCLREWVWVTFPVIFGCVRCWMCGRRIWCISDMALDHWKSPRGLGGGFRDDRFVKPACHKCNGEKGSKRVANAEERDE